MMKRIGILLLSLTLLCSAALAEEPAVVVPEIYQQSGTLSLYAAVTRTDEAAPLYDLVQAEWFNQSGEPACQNGSRRGRVDVFTFPDGAVLTAGPEYVDYVEYDGTMETLDPFGEGAPTETLPRPSLKNAIGTLAAGARQCWPELENQPQLESTQLGNLSLEDAKATLEDLMEKMGLEGWQCVYALDMSVSRIHALGQNYREKLEGISNTPIPAFETADETDQGFYLYYEKFLNGVSLEHEAEDGSAFSISAYVTASGLHSFVLRDTHAIGDVYDTPDTLISASQALSAFEGGNPRRIRDGFESPEPYELCLTYRPARAASKKDGVVMTPAWFIRYTYLDVSPCDGWAWYSALDGTLMEDCYSR